jgi:tetratricopeptide (TPR) repeat protein
VESPGKLPFFFIVGAGISAPSIPLAGQMVEHFKTKANDASPDGSLSPMESYSEWFSKAYPQSKNRQNYLSECIRGKSITSANLRLAHILLSRKVGTLVVTPNFDDLLSRALALFGESPLVCDHPQTTQRMPLVGEEIRVVHVHGTYKFYDCCNLSSEVKAQARASDRGTPTMGRFLSGALRERSPIVVGYSGWDDDVIMSNLREHLSNNPIIPYNLYWFCHKAREIETLPHWLQEYAHVRFICPPPNDHPASSRLSRMGSSRANPSGPVPAPEGVPTTLDGATFPQLDASTVFDSFISMLETAPPPIIADPLLFFEAQLRESLPQEDDVYGVNVVADIVNKARQSGIAGAKSDIERLKDASARADYEEIARITTSMDTQALDGAALAFVASRIFDAVQRMGDSELRVSGCDVACQIAQRLADTRSVGIAQRIKGFTLLRMGRVAEALAALDEAVKTFDEANGGETRLLALQTLQDQVAALNDLGDFAGVLQRYSKSERFQHLDGPAAEMAMASLMFHRAVALLILQKYTECEEALDELIARFVSSPLERIQEVVAKALFNKGLLLQRLDRHDEAVKLFEEFEERFGESPVAKELGADRRLAKAISLVPSGNPNEAIKIIDIIVDQNSKDDQPQSNAVVGRALVAKEFALVVAGRKEEALAVCDQVINVFEDSTDEELQTHVVQSLANKMMILVDSRNYEGMFSENVRVRTLIGTIRAPEQRARLAGMLVHMADLMATTGQFARQLALTSDARPLMEAYADENMQIHIARLIANRGFALMEVGRWPESIEVCDDVVQRFSGREGREFVICVASAKVNKADALIRLGRSAEAAPLLSEVLEEWQDDEEEDAKDVVAEARRLKSIGT